MLRQESSDTAENAVEEKEANANSNISFFMNDFYQVWGMSYKLSSMSYELWGVGYQASTIKYQTSDNR